MNILSQPSINDPKHPNYYSSNPKDHSITEFNTWDEIFTFQGRKDGANYQMLMNWLKKNFETPKIIKDEHPGNS